MVPRGWAYSRGGPNVKVIQYLCVYIVTYLASNTRAIIPDASGVAALVPTKPLSHVFSTFMVVCV